MEALPLLATHTLFLYKHFYKQDQAEITKYQANAKQQPEAELLTLENYSDSSTTL